MPRYRRQVIETHQPDHVLFSLRERACELLALVMADQPVMKLSSRMFFEGVIDHYREYRDDRIKELLILLAAAYRPASWKRPKIKNTTQHAVVGSLFIDGGEDPEDLSMHEACNKIIHTQEFGFETKKVRGFPLEYLRENVLLTGTKGKQDWMAVVWIPEFCDAALTMPFTASELGLF